MSTPFLSPKIYYGSGSIKNLRYLRGKKALIITDKTMVELGIVNKVQKQLKKTKPPMESMVFDEVQPDPHDTTCFKGAEIAREYNPDWIIGIGGGSAMDSAKLIWILYEDPDINLGEITLLKRLKLRNKARLITIPTTSGTGAEVTFAAVITNTKEQKKMTLMALDLVPDIAFVDPNLAKSMPPKLTAATGLDALTHAVEAYISLIKNDFTDGESLKAIQLIMEWLPKSYEGSKDLENQDKKPREKMHYAATIAGLAFGNAGAGLAHGIGHSIGAVFHIPHGFCVGILLPYIIEYFDDTSRNYFSEITNFLNLKNGENATNVLAKSIRKLIKSIEVPTCFKEYGLMEEEFKKNLERIVELSMADFSSKTGPKRATESDIKKIIEAAYYGKPIQL
ncbi:MAG: iron-containing alcohol dehydrogenase [Candidatus Helarchaeota archaeon]